MARRHRPKSKPGVSEVDAALAAMNSDELREIVRDLVLELDDRAQGRLASRLIECAAHNASGWTPTSPSGEVVSEIIAFAEAARRVGYADPSEVDDYLRQDSNAFLDRDYATAFQIFHVLLVPIAEVEIDLGQHEMVDEVLGADVSTCAAQYVVSMYMTSAPAQRAHAVRAALDEMSSIGHFWDPLREMERVAAEPLPEMDDFLPRWRSLTRDNAAHGRRDDGDTDLHRWLREVVQRMDGIEGVAELARITKRTDDLRAWCRMLAESRDWKAALSACKEAAEIVSDGAYSRGDFLDGAALAAQELGRRNLPARLEHAWREAPSVLRLCRWLSSSGSKGVVRKRAALALGICPKKAHRQRALLQVLLGAYEPAAKRLAEAPGLGWSDSEHPGHLLFGLFRAILGGDSLGDSPGSGPPSTRGMDVDELEWMTADRDEPRLAAPAVHEIMELAGAYGPPDAAAGQAVLRAMRKAAERRLAGVTESKSRRHYGHAAGLVAACASLDSTPETRRWAADLRAEYRRYPSLQRELDAQLGRGRR